MDKTISGLLNLYLTISSGHIEKDFLPTWRILAGGGVQITDEQNLKANGGYAKLKKATLEKLMREMEDRFRSNGFSVSRKNGSTIP
tara:strand:- start:3730 stop:3987 length:258 start_codon:yes stop_codon:yes gene_type:complete